MNIGLLCLNKRDFDQALAYFNKAHKIDSKSASVLNNIGLIHLIKRNPNKAISAIREASRIENNDPVVYNNLGVCFVAQRNFKKAVTNFKIAYSLNKDAKNILSNLANAYQELIDQFEYILDRVGQMMGKDKTTISNSLRLLSLSDEIKAYLEDGAISTGHAKALLSVVSEKKRSKIAKTIAKKGISVRETENLIRRITEPRKAKKRIKDPEIMQIEENLQHKLGTKVNILRGKKRGRIEIQFFSNEDLQRLLKMILQ